LGHAAVGRLFERSRKLSLQPQRIEDSVDGASDASVLTAVSAASGTVVTMGKQVSSTFQQLRKLDPAGESRTLSSRRMRARAWTRSQG